MLEIEMTVLGPVQTNAYILADHKARRCVVIDPGMQPAALIAKLEGYEVEAILLTHAHFDHIGGVDELRRLKGCPVYIHDAEADWLTDPRKNGSLRWPELGVEIVMDPAEYSLEHGQTLQLLGEQIEVYHTPGHSPGSVSFRIGDKLFGGDVLFRHSVGRTDLPGGNAAELHHSIHSVLFQLPPDTIVYPGHGPQTTIGYEMEHNPYV